ncbi:hypothetical protein ACJW30_03G033700 [Castanea mollissima]
MSKIFSNHLKYLPGTWYAKAYCTLFFLVDKLKLSLKPKLRTTGKQSDLHTSKMVRKYGTEQNFPTNTNVKGLIIEKVKEVPPLSVGIAVSRNIMLIPNKKNS